MGIAQPQGLGVRAQRAVMHTGQMFAPGLRATRAVRSRTPMPIGTGGAHLAANWRGPAPGHLGHIRGLVKAGLIAQIVEFGDRHQGVPTDANHHSRHILRRRFAHLHLRLGQRRRLLAIGEKHQAVVAPPRRLQRGAQAAQHVAVALPGHTPIEGLDGAGHGIEILTDFNRLKKDKAAPLRKDRQSHARPAGQMSQKPRQREAQLVQAAGGRAVKRIVPRHHAAGDVDDEHKVIDRAFSGQARLQRGRQRRQGGAGQKRAAQGKATHHGRPRGNAGRSAHRFFGCGCSGSPPCSSGLSGKSRTRREATSRLTLASNASGCRVSTLR